jgi:hypothetical protein
MVSILVYWDTLKEILAGNMCANVASLCEFVRLCAVHHWRRDSDGLYVAGSLINLRHGGIIRHESGEARVRLESPNSTQRLAPALPSLPEDGRYLRPCGLPKE